MSLALVHNKPTYRPRAWQVAAKEAFLSHQGDKGCLIVASTGCHAPGQGVLMYDGTIRLIENVRVGELLMGPDSTPRVVLETVAGRAPMVRIVPNKGPSWVVTEDHVLSLVRTGQGPGRMGGEVTDIKVRDLPTMGKTWRHVHKLFRVPVEFAERRPQPVQPYLLGVLLGDGCLVKSPIEVTKPDYEIGDALRQFCADHGTEVRDYTPDGRCSGWKLRGGTLSSWLSAMGVLGTVSETKFVPHTYKTASRDERLELIAGLLDTDGHYTKKGYDFISKSERLSNDLVFLCRSVGLAAYVRPSEKYCQTGGGGIYWRVSVSGDCSVIPCRIERKKAKKREQKKDVLRFGFTVQPEGIGPFYGVRVDGDNRYLLDDFTVTHNSGKTAFGHYLAVDYLDRGERVLWIANQKTLVKQPYATLSRWWPDLVGKAGIVMAGRNEPDAQIVYASKDTIRNDKRMAQLLEAGAFALVVVDEAHTSIAPTFLGVIQKSRAGARLLGLTATPHRDDTKNLSDLWELAYSYGILDAIEDEVLVPPFVTVEKVPHLDLSTVRSSGGDYNTEDLGEALLKAHIVEHTVAAMAQTYVYEELPFREAKVMEGLRGRQVLIHTATKEQARLTADALNKDGWTARYVSGDTPESEVERLFALFSERKIDVLLAAQKLSVGVDLPVADAQVFASPTRSWVLYVQRLGRGLRTHGEKKNCLVLDLVGCTKDHSIVSAPVLVDGVDCEKSEDGRHRFLAVEGSGEGRCQDCGKVIKCMKRLSGHEFKDGRCKACGAPQCAESPDKQHHFVPWEDHKRSCIHCALEIPDPLAALVDRSPSQKEPVNWQAIKAPRKVWGASIGKIGTLFTVQHGDDAFRVFMHTRDKLIPLAPEPVDGRIARMLTDDVARRGTKVRGFYGGAEIKAAKISFVRMEALARKLRVWEA